MSYLGYFSWKSLSKRQKSLEEFHTLLLVIIGVLAFVISGILSYKLSSLVPYMLDATEKFGISMAAAEAWTLVSIFAVPLWYFGCLATRCHSILYEKWFK